MIKQDVHAMNRSRGEPSEGNDARRINVLSHLAQDLRYAIRIFGHAPDSGTHRLHAGSHHRGEPRRVCDHLELRTGV